MESASCHDPHDPADMLDSDEESSSNVYSFLTPLGYTNSTRCGYCGSKGGGQPKRFSYYASTVSLTPTFYQTLLNRYWRRSGHLLYRPNQRQSCCPHYSIRLDSMLFKPSRDQRHTVNRWNKYVLGTKYASAAARLHPLSRQDAKRRNTEFDLIERLHESELAYLKVPPQPAHEFSVTLEPDTFTEEKFALYENYQRIVHKEGPSDITKSGFRRFLCDSPLNRRLLRGKDGNERRLGSYHQCYRLDGQLVAIGVLDLLPRCVSSVYFLYHESIHEFAPGKLAALREITLAKEDGYQYWYPGFYIHNCPKMRYKIDYRPQYILDPETLQWDLLDETILGLLDKKPYVSLSAERVAQRSGSLQLPVPAEDVAEIDPSQASSESSSQSEEEEEEEAVLFDSDFPGIMGLAEVLDLDIDDIALRFEEEGRVYYTNNLVVWSEQTVPTAGQLKTKVAELVAAIGPDLMQDFCLDFSK